MFRFHRAQDRHDAFAWVRRASAARMSVFDRRPLHRMPGTVTGDLRLERTGHRHAGVLAPVR